MISIAAQTTSRRAVKTYTIHSDISIRTIRVRSSLEAGAEFMRLFADETMIEIEEKIEWQSSLIIPFPSTTRQRGSASSEARRVSHGPHMGKRSSTDYNGAGGVECDLIIHASHIPTEKEVGKRSITL